MRPFNLEEAKAGAPICTRDGRDVRILCFDLQCDTPIIAASKDKENDREEPCRYFENGNLLYYNKEHYLDLFLKDTEPKLCCGDVCGDNRFEIIEKAKKHILESTNIESRQEEMNVLDNFLFRCWQMGWLEQYGPTGAKAKAKEPTLDDYTTIKTYEDACKALNVKEIPSTALITFNDNAMLIPKHIIALMKLETISRALRNGWKPNKETDLPYMPVFEERMQCLGAYMSGSIPRLYQETEEKAEYFGTQFIDLWKEYLAEE